MSYSEVQKAIEQWPSDEQDRLAAFLTVLRLRRDPAYLGEIDLRLRDLEPANWMVLNEVKDRLKER